MFARLYNAFTWSMLLSVLMFLNTWLEMRVNLGLVFFAMIVVLFILQSAISPLRKLCGTFTASLLSVIVSFIGIYWVLGSKRIAIIPASIVREGIMQSRIPFATINAVIIAIAVIGLAIVFFTGRHER